ncbi:MAG: sulfite oxidase heme-binding subunit YedZ [Anaerolineales bacterium]
MRRWHRILAHGVGLATLAWLGIVYAFRLEPLPERFVMLRSGTLGLIFLVASLACTPLSRWVWPPAVQVRRALGLYGFTHIGVHLVVYAVAENGLDFNLIVRDLDERRAMLIGLIAFALLIPLALTSTAGWQRRLGKRWRILHRLVYIATPLSVWHYLWLDRDILTWPIVYAVIVGALLAARLLLRRARAAPSKGKPDETTATT